MGSSPYPLSLTSVQTFGVYHALGANIGCCSLSHALELALAGVRTDCSQYLPPGYVPLLPALTVAKTNAPPGCSLVVQRPRFPLPSGVATLSSGEFQSIVRSSSAQATRQQVAWLVMFHADWCSACTNIQPMFGALARRCVPPAWVVRVCAVVLQVPIHRRSWSG